MKKRSKQLCEQSEEKPLTTAALTRSLKLLHLILFRLPNFGLSQATGNIVGRKMNCFVFAFCIKTFKINYNIACAKPYLIFVIETIEKNLYLAHIWS